MKKGAILAVIMAVLITTGCSSNNIVKEENKNTVATEQSKDEKVVISDKEIEKKDYKRIVAGSVSTLGYLEALAVEPAAVVQSKMLPEKYKDYKKVGTSIKLNEEILAEVNPDIILMDGALKGSQSAAIIDKYNGVYLNGNSYKEVINNIENLGKIFNKVQEAKEKAEKLKKAREEIVKESKNKTSYKTLILSGTTESFTVATGNSFVGDLANTLGLENVADKITTSKESYVPLSMEAIAKEDPDKIIILPHGNPEEALKAVKEMLKKDIWKNTKAAKNDGVVVLDMNKIGLTATVKADEALKYFYEGLNK